MGTKEEPKRYEFSTLWQKAKEQIKLFDALDVCRICLLVLCMLGVISSLIGLFVLFSTSYIMYGISIFGLCFLGCVLNVIGLYSRKRISKEEWKKKQGE